MESVRLGVLLPGGRPVGDGIHHAVRAPVATLQGDVIAILKDVPAHELIIETFCALLGRALNLPIPEPLLVIDEARQALVAGSIDVGYPSLHQPVLTPYLPLLSALLAQWPELVPAACFDEWIANPDRHGGNLLFDGHAFWLIDHGLAMRGQPTDATDNHLMAIAVAARTNDLARQRLKREVLGYYRTYTEETAMEIGQALASIDALNPVMMEIENSVRFLRQRLLSLTAMTTLRIRTSQGDLDYAD